MLDEEIRINWQTDITGHVHIISSLENTDTLAWTIKFPDSYGVAIPYDGEEINESFANARIYSMEIPFENEGIKPVLLLTSNTKGIEQTFSSLCAEFVIPGTDGTNRSKILSSPHSWWKEWKEILGNKNIEDRVYDVLGELCVLKRLLEMKEDASWGGPDGRTYDIETEKRYVEVKSTIVKSSKEITISSQFQLQPPDKPLNLVFCQFEPSAMTGVSIDGILEDISNLGYDAGVLNSKLVMSSRKKTFILHGLLKYNIDSDFPRIVPESFINGVIPKGIKGYTYTVDLDGLDSESMLEKNAQL